VPRPLANDSTGRRGARSPRFRAELVGELEAELVGELEAELV
jgi:hypothetical protein